MEFDIERKDNILVIKPKIKNLDSLCALIFKSKLVEIIGNDEKVVIDLSDVSFVDSAGLSAMISVYKSLGSGRDHFAVCGVNKAIFELFKCTGVNKIWNICDTRDQALASLSVTSLNLGLPPNHSLSD